MKGIIVYDTAGATANRHYIDFYFDACKKRGMELDLILTENLSWGIRDGKGYLHHCGEPLCALDFAIMRTPNVVLAKHLEFMDVKVFNNSDVIEVANDKRLTHMRVAKAGIPAVDTRFNVTMGEKMDFPLVVKPTRGRGGRGVMLVRDETELIRAISGILPEPYVVQKLTSEPGRDLRVYFVGNEIVCAMLRESKTDFRSNYGLGGTARAYTLNDGEKRLARKVAALFDLSYAGVDFIFDEGKMVFNEVEDAVGARMLYANTDIDIVDLYTAYIYERVCAGK